MRAAIRLLLCKSMPAITGLNAFVLASSREALLLWCIVVFNKFMTTSQYRGEATPPNCPKCLSVRAYVHELLLSHMHGPTHGPTVFADARPLSRPLIPLIRR